MSEQQKTKCHICADYQQQGIWLVQGYICARCLDELSQVSVQDAKYRFFIAKLKELWQAG